MDAMSGQKRKAVSRTYGNMMPILSVWRSIQGEKRGGHVLSIEVVEVGRVPA